MEVLILKIVRGSSNAKISNQLAEDYKLLVTECFQQNPKLSKEKDFRIVPIIANISNFPDSCEIANGELDSPTFLLTHVKGESRMLLNDGKKTNLTVEKSRIYKELEKSLAYINENLFECDLSLERVASEMFVSKFHYCRVFQKHLGLGFKEYVMKKRIEKAKVLLEKGESVTYSCYSVGYNDLTHFSKVFKRLVGITPSKYRNFILS